MIYHAMIIMHINQDIKYANVSLFYVPKDGEKREKNFLSHQPNCIFWKVPFVFGMKGEEKKIKSRKFIPFFPHLTTTSMQEHTHMTLDNTRDKRGLTKDPCHLIDTSFYHQNMTGQNSILLNKHQKIKIEYLWCQSRKQMTGVYFASRAWYPFFLAFLFFPLSLLVSLQ